MFNLEKLSSDLKALRTKTNTIISNVTFDYDEQELIHRVLKSVYNQFRSDMDKNNAKSILDKTRWANGK